VSAPAAAGSLVSVRRSPVLVGVVGGHPVILGVVRLACHHAPDLICSLELTGSEASARAAELAVADVVVLDLDLPDDGGLQLLRSLRSDGFAGKVLVLSDRSDGATALEALRFGADGYLAKADGLRRVGDAIRRLAAGERVVDEAVEQAAVAELGRFARRTREGAEVAARLTSRELEILTLLADGLTMRQVARRLAISPRTVETHVAKIYRKLGVRTRVQAVARAASIGLIKLG
jgi:DNA-binding NarL/FixJ family response regulator